MSLICPNVSLMCVCVCVCVCVCIVFAFLVTLLYVWQMVVDMGYEMPEGGDDDDENDDTRVMM